jgi:hypothetical protein
VYVNKQLFTDERDYLACDDHKTADSLGEAVKHIFPCVKECFRLYFALPKPRESDRAFRPVKGLEVSFQYLLKAYSKKYLAGTQALGVNLLRKLFSKHVAAAMGLDSQALKNLEVADKH